MWFHIIKGLNYFLFSRHKKGHGIHSPFMFDLIDNVFCDETSYQVYETINYYRQQQLSNHEFLSVTDYGAKAKGNTELKKISKVMKHSVISSKYGELLFRMVNHYKPETIIELGTCLGFGTMYLSLGNEQSKVVTLEGSEEYVHMAQSIWKNLSLKNIESHTGTFETLLPSVLENIKTIDFVFFDGNHTYDATMNYFNQCVAKAHTKTIFIFDDIYWSMGMYHAWKDICSHEKVRLTIDIFRMGFVFFNENILSKQHKTIRF